MFTKKVQYLAVLALIIILTIIESQSTTLMPMIDTDLTSLVVNECMQPTTKSKPRQIKRLSVAKCCPLGQQLAMGNEVPCQPSKHSALTITVLYVDKMKKQVIYYDKVSPNFEMDFFKPVLKEPLATEGDLYLTSTGTLLEIDSDPCQYIEHKRYCIDSQLGSDTLIGFYENLHDAETTLVLWMAFSIVCLTTTVVIFTVVKRFGDLIGKSLLMISCFLLLQYCCHILKHSNIKYETRIKIIIRYSIISAFYWFTVMWSDILYSVWMYLPHNKHRNKRVEWYCFACLVIVQISLMGVLAVFDVQFTTKPVYYSLLGIFLCICIGLAIASFVGFRRLKEARKTAFLVEKQAECTTAACLLKKRTFSEEHITYIRMMFQGASFLLGYLILCMTIKLATKFDYMDKTYEIFNSTGGVIIFIMFVCVKKPFKFIKNWWEQLADEHFLKKYYNSICSCC